MDEKVQKILNEIKIICENHGISHLYLFGSYAKGTELVGSDIDIVIKGVKDYKKLKDDIDNIKTLKFINIFNYDTIKNEYLKKDIDQYAKLIY